MSVLSGGLAYALWPSSGSGPSSPPEPLIMSDEESSNGGGLETLDAHPKGYRKEEGGGDASSEVEQASSASRAEQDYGGEVQTEEEPETKVVDSKEVLGVVEDVLQKSADQLLQEDQYRATKVDVAETGMSQRDDSAQPSENRQDPLQSAGRDAERGETNVPERSQLQEESEAAQSALMSGLADSSGQVVASHVVKSTLPISLKQSKDDTKKETDLGKKRRDVSQGGQHANSEVMMSHDDKELSLGIEKLRRQLNAAGLIAAATSRRKRTAPEAPLDWSSFPARHKQAEADAQTFTEAIDYVAQKAQKAAETARATAEAALIDSENTRKEMERQANDLQQTLKNSLRKAESEYRKRLNEERMRLSVHYNEMVIEERLERQNKIDALRLQLGSLEEALKRRSNAAAASQMAHEVAQGAFVLRDALASGDRLDRARAYLQKVCANDSLLTAAIGTLPRGLVLPTSMQLFEEFSDVERAAVELSLLPCGQGGGMLAAAAAKAFGALKIREPMSLNSFKSIQTNDCDLSINTKMSLARFYINQGKLLEAAEVVEDAVHGTPAAHAVGDWVQRTRMRAIAEQVATLLEAQAIARSLGQIA